MWPIEKSMTPAAAVADVVFPRLFRKNSGIGLAELRIGR